MIVGSAISTQRVIGSLTEIGASVSLSQRLSMTLYDLIHFGTLYGAFICLAFIAAFLAGGLVFRIAKFGRPIVYIVAGAAAMLVMLILMQKVFFGVPIVAGARDDLGLGLQMLAGGVGGYVFHRLSLSRRSTLAPS